MESKKMRFIIIGIVLVVIIAVAIFFVINRNQEKPTNQNNQNINEAQSNEPTDPVPDDEPIESLKNATITPIIE
ncbi:MAG: hypothetical protein HFJ52_06785 [Clostridia bacterium]|jgi:flagellar basal body-associated protein FliL|nr:hypothetical protein [Clostridia bacterium]